jgi:hypothetical protein
MVAHSDLIARIRPLQDDLTIDEKIEIVGQVVLTHDEQIEQLLADAEKLRADVARLEKVAGYGKDAT